MTVIAGVDVSHWLGLVGHRVFDDGRVAIVTQRIFNAQLAVSSPVGWRIGTWQDAY